METPIRLNSRYGYLNGDIVPIGHHAPITAHDPDVRVIVQAANNVRDLEENFTALFDRIDINAAPVRERLAQLIEETVPDSIIKQALKNAGIEIAAPSTSTKPDKRKKRRVVSTQPTPPASNDSPPATTTNVTARVHHNVEKSGIEIAFDSKPDPAVIAQLKSKGYRFSSRQQLWYCAYTHDGYDWAKQFNATEPTPSPMNTSVVSTPPAAPTSPSPMAQRVETTQPLATAGIMDQVNALFAARK